MLNRMAAATSGCLTSPQQQGKPRSAHPSGAGAHADTESSKQARPSCEGTEPSGPES